MGINRIDDVFASRKALICYAPVGDPYFSLDMLGIYQACGVDIIEIGLPNQNPYADGEIIAGSMRRMSRAVSMDDMVRLTAEVKSRFPKLAPIWMCYECADLGNAFSSAGDIGLQGLLMVGFEKRPDKSTLLRMLHDRTMHHVGFVSAQLQTGEVAAARNAGGFVFLQAFNGKTGARSDSLPPALKDKIASLKRFGVTAPIAVGFGISTPDQARQAVQYGADGVITGSACVEAALAGAQALEKYLTEMRYALDNAAA